MLEYPATP